MPKSLSKVQKHIAKKRGGKPTALHENSRDSQRLRTACMRDEKLLRVASSRNKQNQPHLERISHCRAVAQSRPSGPPFTLSDIQTAIGSFLHRDDEELTASKKARRPGRPASAREDLLRQRQEREEKEYDGGFYWPDMQDEATLAKLGEWDGHWISCNVMKFVRISRAGERRESVWPPKGLS